MRQSMDTGRQTEFSISRNASQKTFNSRYLASVVGGDIVIQNYIDDHAEVLTVALAKDDWCSDLAILALSPGFSHYLAVAARGTIVVYDIEAHASKIAIYGNDRATTALCWSANGHQIASGSIDGSISIWNLSVSLRPTSHCKLGSGAIHSIAWSSEAVGALAYVDDDALSVWKDNGHTQVVANFARACNRIEHLCWSQDHPWTLLGSSREGRLHVWDLHHTLHDAPDKRASNRSSSTPIVSLISQSTLFHDIELLAWAGEQTAAVLYEKGRRFAVIDLRNPTFGSIEWELGFSHAFNAFITTSVNGKDMVRMLSHDKQRTYALPGRRVGHERPFGIETELSKDSFRLPTSDSSSRRMTLVTIAKLRQARHDAPHNLASLHEHSGDVVDDKRPDILDLSSEEHKRLSTTSTQATPTRMRVSRLAAKDDSSMPFLSPAIPAKQPSLTVDQSFDDIMLPDRHSEGYFGSFSTATAHDSDSDDDNFDLKGSKDNTPLRPGSVNVPLPRSCGAVFSPVGTIILFRPPETKVSAPKMISVVEQADDGHQDLERTARLFPMFGNLLADISMLIATATDTSTSIVSESKQVVIGALGIDKASYNSKESWKPHSLSAAPDSQPTPRLPSVQVSVHELHDSKLNEHLAKHYRVLVHANEKGSEMCLANAAIAIDASRREDAFIWQMLAKVIEDQGPHDYADVRARQRAIDWSDHPLGATWLVRRMYATAELSGNLQMLACITAVLVGSTTPGYLLSAGDLANRLPVRPRSTDRTSPAEVSPSSLFIRANSNASQLFEQSPTKPRTASAISSRTPSMPTTPRIESSSSTPPWTFASLTQSSSRLSLSRSASPENTRGSFSAAVKSYAQSVTKFAAYGTSPPIRKSGPSPNNELSSSLPGVGGSWTKSVSFASTATTRESSTLGRNSMDMVDDYDSEDTIEDVVVAAQPNRDASFAISITMKNEDAFSDEPLGLASSPLFPSDLLAKCRLWVQAYAERLRCWKLGILAVEFDNIGGVLNNILLAMAEDDTGFELSTKKQAAIFCSICQCVIQGLEQVCQGCHQSCHMACLQQLLASDTNEVECPGGCGLLL